MRLDRRRGFRDSSPIQFREDQLRGKRPACPRGCPGMVHKHGCYERYTAPAGVKEQEERERIQRYVCSPCGATFSVLPPHRLPYRPVRAERLEGDFDQRAGIQTNGLDPPPRAVETGCLKRAWSALNARVVTLKNAFGQLLDSTVSDGLSLWRALRQSFDSVSKMLAFLSEHHRISLLGNYRCLQPPLRVCGPSPARQPSHITVFLSRAALP